MGHVVDFGEDTLQVYNYVVDPYNDVLGDDVRMMLADTELAS